MPEQDDVYRDGLMRMADDEFRLVWELIVGERPAIMLERGEMIDALRSLIPIRPAEPGIPAYGRGDQGDDAVQPEAVSHSA